MNLKRHIIPAFCLVIASAFLLTGCIYDYLDMDTANGSGVGYEEPSLVFDFNLTPFDNDGSGSILGGTQLDHGEEWENYIDPSKLRVLFCDSLGNYLFEVSRRYVSIISKTNQWSGTSDVYRVVIPRSGLYSPERPQANNDAIKEAVEQKGFKIAVLANWPSVMEGRPTIDPETNDEIVASETEPTNLDFEWDPTHTKPNSHISYLSHCMPDYIYGVSTVDDKGEKVEPYTHLPYHPSGINDQKGQMGIFKSWVGYTYKSQAQASQFIRNGMDIDGDEIEGDIHFTYSYKDNGNPADFTYTDYSYVRTVDSENVYHLDNIWRLWNFSAGENCPYHNQNSAKVNDYWSHRNNNVLIYGLKQQSWPNSFNIKDSKGETLIQSNNSRSRYVAVQNGNDESGYLQLPNSVSTADVQKIITDGAKTASTQVTNFENSALMFKAYSEGTLRIRAKGNSNSRIAVITKIPGSPNSEKVQYVTMRGSDGISQTSDNPFFDPLDRGEPFKVREEYGQGAEFFIQPNSNQYLEVYVAAVDGEVDLYEVEYMRARHLYDNARNAIMPSNLHPIPMYGIQNFDPIGPYLLPNQTFNMSDHNDNPHLFDLINSNTLPKYNYRNIYMLRSVAKVELRFNKNVFTNIEPEHVFMRVMNRTARCEPADVINPTDWVWYGQYGLNSFNGATTVIDPEADPSSFVGALQEFKNIINYGPLHRRTLNSGEEEVAGYRRLTSWFYGIWGANNPALPEDTRAKYYWNKPWDWNGQVSSVPHDLPYPRIFNTRIDRSDFCRFHKVPDKDGYIRFIMYVPEKNIDDTDSRGHLNNSPKVQHIEIRFKNLNKSQNMDDNDCYRIYFTDYYDNGKKMNDTWNRNQYDEAERRDDNMLLNMLQPVLRNCHYVFTINSINAEKVGVNFQICGAANRTGQTFVIK